MSDMSDHVSGYVNPNPAMTPSVVQAVNRQNAAAAQQAAKYTATGPARRSVPRTADFYRGTEGIHPTFAPENGTHGDVDLFLFETGERITSLGNVFRSRYSAIHEYVEVRFTAEARDSWQRAVLKAWQPGDGVTSERIVVRGAQVRASAIPNHLKGLPCYQIAVVGAKGKFTERVNSEWLLIRPLVAEVVADDADDADDKPVVKRIVATKAPNVWGDR